MGSAHQVADILADWRDLHDAGEAPDPHDVIRAHPECADALREHFDALGLLGLAFVEPEVDSTPLPERLGDYRVLECLGEGGMGTVYLAETERATAGLEPGARVALKVIHTHLLSRRGFFKRFLREAELGRQVDHENVVHTIDVDAVRDDTETSHFLVMEYVEGRTLRDLLHDLEIVPEALLREIAAQAAAGLAAIHAAGIVHRDLKPENLLITPDHRVQIMDLGVARGGDEAFTLTDEGQFVGSLAYAAPEQFGKQETGPAADLYALGVVLYELATGDNPFQREEFREVIAAHLTETPPPPADCNADVSEFLSELVSTLLEKKPADRLHSAASLLEVLRAGERSSWWDERRRVVAQGARRLPRIAVRRETHLCGRETELNLLRQRLDEAHAGEGSVVLIEGEAGIGKTRLIDAFVREASSEGVTFLYGSYPPSGGMGGLSDAVLAHFEHADLEDSIRAHLTATPRLVEPFAALLRHDVVSGDAKTLSGDALHSAFCHLLRGMAQDTTVVWVVEDLHFAEPQSRDLMLSMARAAARHRVLLVLTSRRGLPDDWLAHLGRLPTSHRAALGRLGARQVIELLREALRSEGLAVKLGGKIALKSDGVPFFVFEMIRGLREGQFITELPDGSWVETRVVDRIEIPSAVRDLVEARLSELGRDERSLLDIGAVQGFQFDPDLVARVLERSRFAVLQDLAEIERRLGVVRAEGFSYRFDHHQFQEVVYESLADALRVECHALLANAIAAREGGETDEPQPDDAIAHQLAHHYLHGHRPAAALPHLESALRYLAGVHRNEAAVDLADRALAHRDVLTGPARVAILSLHADRLDLMERREDERKVLDELVELTEAGDDTHATIRAYYDLGWHLGKAAQYEDAVRVHERGLALAKQLADDKLLSSAYGGLGLVRHGQGRIDESVEFLRNSLVAARRCGDQLCEARALSNLALPMIARGDLKEFRRLTEKSMALLRQLGAERNASMAEANLGIGLRMLGEYEEALACQQRRLSTSREMGDRKGEADALGNAGIVLRMMGRLEESRAHHESHLAMAQEIGDTEGETRALISLANTLDTLGLSGAAAEYQASALELSRQIGHVGHEITALQNLSIQENGFRNYAAAESRARESLELSEPRSMKDKSADTLRVLAMAIRGTGRTAEAERVFDEAIERLRACSLRPPLSTALLEKAILLADHGRGPQSVPLLREALELGTEMKAAGTILLAQCQLALVGESPVEDALSTLAESKDSLAKRDQRRVHYLLWKATGDPTHLTAAHAHAEFLWEHAPTERREQMRAGDPVEAAWREHMSAV